MFKNFDYNYPSVDTMVNKNKYYLYKCIVDYNQDDSTFIGQKRKIIKAWNTIGHVVYYTNTYQYTIVVD